MTVEQGALSGMRVIDLGQWVAGPLAAMLLADQGADVIHVDPPGGPRLAGPADAFYNRGKRRISLDLKSPADLETARSLAAGADVVIENFRPGTMDRLGLDPARLLASNPRLVHCSLPGFGADDPRREWPAWEGVVLAEMAGYVPIGKHWAPVGRDSGDVDDPARPLFSPLPIASDFAGLLGALGIVMALISRERSGLGQRVEVPLADAYLDAVGYFAAIPGFPDGDYFPKLHILPHSSPTADGRHIDWSPYPRFVEWLLDAEGLGDSLRADGLLDFDLLKTDAEANREYSRRYSEMIASKPGAYWDTLADRLGVPMSLVRSPAEWVACEQARRSGTVVEVDDPELGPIWIPGSPVEMDGTPPEIGPRRLPDDDRGAILAEADGRSRAVPVPAPDGGSLTRPLEGISVVDLTQVVAGPLAGKLLADFGAEVVKVNFPGPTINNAMHGPYLNGGKRSILLDVQAAAGQDVLWRLIEGSDVVLENFAGGTADRYGIGYEEAAARNPALVYTTIANFARSGPWGHRRGHDQNAQAATGVTWLLAGGEGREPLADSSLMNDGGTGILAAFATSVALFHRMRGGGGQRVGASLTQTSTLHLGPYLIDEASAEEFGGLEATGWSAVNRLYEAADGWFFLGASAAQLPDLLVVVDRAGADAPTDVDDAGGRLAALLAERFRSGERAEWARRLREAGLGAGTVATLPDLFADPVWYRRGRIVDDQPNVFGRPAPGVVTPAWLAATPPRTGAHTGPLGSHTVDVLADLGLTPEAIRALFAEGVAGGPMASDFHSPPGQPKSN